MVFMPNITTNHAFTCTNLLDTVDDVKFESKVSKMNILNINQEQN